MKKIVYPLSFVFNEILITYMHPVWVQFCPPTHITMRITRILAQCNMTINRTQTLYGKQLYDSFDLPDLTHLYRLLRFRVKHAWVTPWFPIKKKIIWINNSVGLSWCLISHDSYESIEFIFVLPHTFISVHWLNSFKWNLIKPAQRYK